MSVPTPPRALEGHCSAVDDNTLYVLSPAGLQSLQLKENATWSQEPSGVSVQAPACVASETQRALYVVGGSSSDDNYGGLQRYFFGNKTWETLSPLTNNMQGRVNHSVAYLADSEGILVYAGSQPNAPSFLSSQTFVISTEPPYNIQSFTSKAPPANTPILAPWNSSAAVMVGGSQYNTDVFTFDPSTGWQQYGTNLTDTIDPAARGAIVDGSDGSKVLAIYNVNDSPNTVSQIVLQDANGQPAATGQTIGGHSSRKRKRDLTLNNWPSYNSTGAPTATRTDCAVAQGASGMSVISGGNNDAPFALFDQSDNSWVDTSTFFGSKEKQQPLVPSSTASTATSATSTSSSKPSSTKAAASSGDGMTAHQRMLRTLGITLGILCGIAAIFILTLLYLRWRKTRQTKQAVHIDEKPGNRLSFQDRGASNMNEAGHYDNELSPPNKDRYTPGLPAGGSHSSLAIIAGKFGNNRSPAHQQQGSYDSMTHLVKDRNGATVMSSPVEMIHIGDKRTPVQRKPVLGEAATSQVASTFSTDKEIAPAADGNRSSGWSKYFATSGPEGPNGLSHLPAAYLKSSSNSNLSVGDHSQSQYPSGVSRIPSSVLIPPLNIDFNKTLDGQRLSHVMTGSPSFSNSREDLARQGSTGEMPAGMKGLIVTPRPDSRDRASQISGYSLSTNKRTTVGSTLSSNLTSDYYNESGHTPWTPTSNTFKDHVNSRPPSSTYAASVNEPRLHSRGKSPGFFPGSGTAYRPPTKSKMSRMSAELIPPKALGMSAQPAEDRDSTVTVFPRGVPSAYYADRNAAKESEMHQAQPSNQQTAVSDMSWLNLGLGGSQNRT
ncbi:hypothetical protein LTR08_005924 [Meristemomyces frigidus]|nr:hypothetical protein LTR08_005924 [Meristemomyces frigidus]